MQVPPDNTISARGGMPQLTMPSLGRRDGPWNAATGHAPDLDQAARVALRGVLDELGERHGLARGRPCLLASARGDVRISQVGHGGISTVSTFLSLDASQQES